MGFPGGSDSRESTCNAGDPSSVAGSGRSPGEGIGYPLQYSWASLVAQLVKNLPVVQKACVQSLAWKDTLEKGIFPFLPTPVFWPGEFHGQRSLAGYSPWGHKESDMTERFHYKDQKIDQWNRIKSIQTDLYMYGQLVLDKGT